MPIDIATTGISSGGIFGAILWVWRKISTTEDKMTALELKMAEKYVPKDDLKQVTDRLDRLEDKIDDNNKDLAHKVDNILNILITKKSN